MLEILILTTIAMIGALAIGAKLTINKLENQARWLFVDQLLAMDNFEDGNKYEYGFRVSHTKKMTTAS